MFELLAGGEVILALFGAGNGALGTFEIDLLRGAAAADDGVEVRGGLVACISLGSLPLGILAAGFEAAGSTVGSSLRASLESNSTSSSARLPLFQFP